MRMLIYCASLVLIAGTVFLLLSIIHVEKTINEKNLQELAICAPESSAVFSTVTVRVLLRAKIRSAIAIVRIEGNMLWSTADTVIILKGRRSFDLQCSFADTGVKDVECVVVVSNRAYKTALGKIVVTLPLKPFLQAAADSLLMITPGVKDTVNYVWEFDNGLIVYASCPRVGFPYLERGSYSGKLYVECARNRSPVIRFNFDNGAASFYNRN